MEQVAQELVALLTLEQIIQNINYLYYVGFIQDMNGTSDYQQLHIIILAEILIQQQSCVTSY